METKEAIAAVIKEDGLDSAIAWIASVVDEKHNRIEQLEAALRPLAKKYLYPDDTGFADELRSDEDWDEQKNDRGVEEYFIERGWIRAARAALGEKKDG
jgi:hypothetical protein